MYALGAEFVGVRVHAETGEVRVLRMVGAFAAGRIMNTRTARSQRMGGMIRGVSAALLSAPRPLWPTQSTMRPVFACATCRYGSRS
jgi:CO/xanthine dehydrogenase Mo-binding subunit